jgi:hypothetical protein
MGDRRVFEGTHAFCNRGFFEGMPAFGDLRVSEGMPAFGDRRVFEGMPALGGRRVFEGMPAFGNRRVFEGVVWHPLPKGSFLVFHVGSNFLSCLRNFFSLLVGLCYFGPLQGCRIPI